MAEHLAVLEDTLLDFQVMLSVEAVLPDVLRLLAVVSSG